MSLVCCLTLSMIGLAWSDELPAGPGPAQTTAVENSLTKPISCCFKDVSLQEACSWFEYLMSVKIDIDDEAMQQARSEEGRHMALEEENVNFADVLAHLLKPMGLTYEVTEKGIHIMNGTVSVPVPPTQVDENVPYSEEEPAKEEESGDLKQRIREIERQNEELLNRLRARSLEEWIDSPISGTVSAPETPVDEEMVYSEKVPRKEVIIEGTRKFDTVYIPSAKPGDYYKEGVEVADVPNVWDWNGPSRQQVIVSEKPAASRDNPRRVPEVYSLPEKQGTWLVNVPFSEKEPGQCLSGDARTLDSNKKPVSRSTLGLEALRKKAIEKLIEQELSKPISVNFHETPLESVCRDLQSMTWINIVLDKVALFEAGIGMDQPLSLRVEHISMKTALNLLLKQVNLTYEIKDDVLLVTTKARLMGGFVQAIYPIAKYLEKNPNNCEKKLIDLITNTIAPESWESAGGPGKIQYFQKEKTLVIAQQTQDVAEQIKELLAALARDNPRRVAEVYSLPEKQGTWLTNVPFSESQDAIDQVVYPVADLVVPADDITPVVCKMLNKPFQPVTNAGGMVPNNMLDSDLIKLITTKIDPESWECNGGAGKLQFFPLGMSLVVVNTKDVQKKVADLLDNLRKLQDIQDKEYAIEMKLMAVQEEGEPKAMQLPKITMLQGRWFTLFEGQTVTLKEGTIQDLLTTKADKPAAVFLLSSRRQKIEQKEDDVLVGLAIRGKVTTLDAGRVRLDLILQKTELDSASRDDIVVVGTSVRSAQRIPVGQAFNHVLQEDDDGEPLVWLEVKVMAVVQLPRAEEERIFRGETQPIPR